MFAIRCYNCEDLDEVVTLWYGIVTHTFANLNHPQPFNGRVTALLNQAKKIYLDGLRLTTLEQNVNARRFYEKHGFVPGGTGINAINGQSNIKYCWNA